MNNSEIHKDMKITSSSVVAKKGIKGNYRKLTANERGWGGGLNI